MEHLKDDDVQLVSGATIDRGNELAAGLILAAGAGMVGALLGAAGGPVGSAMMGVTFARAAFFYVEKIT